MNELIQSVAMGLLIWVVMFAVSYRALITAVKNEHLALLVKYSDNYELLSFPSRLLAIVWYGHWFRKIIIASSLYVLYASTSGFARLIDVGFQIFAIVVLD